jgi:hypothetical protein
MTPRPLPDPFDEAKQIADTLVNDLPDEWRDVYLDIVGMTFLDAAPYWRPTSATERVIADLFVQRDLLASAPVLAGTYCLTPLSFQALGVVLMRTLFQGR